MRRLIFFLFVVISGSVCGQSSSHWGQRILLGPTFKMTDSVTVRTVRDTVLADTVYSGRLETKDVTVGQYTVRAFLNNLGGTSDSISVDVRLGTGFYDRVTRAYNVKWGAWNSVFNLISSGSVQDTLIEDAVSTWFKQHNFRQYRSYDESVSTDSTQLLLTDFLK